MQPPAPSRWSPPPGRGGVDVCVSQGLSAAGERYLPRYRVGDAPFLRRAKADSRLMHAPVNAGSPASTSAPWPATTSRPRRPSGPWLPMPRHVSDGDITPAGHRGIAVSQRRLQFSTLYSGRFARLSAADGSAIVAAPPSQRVVAVKYSFYCPQIRPSFKNRCACCVSEITNSGSWLSPYFWKLAGCRGP